MSCPRPGRFAAQLWVCSVFFAYSASAVADPPALLEGDASGTACADPNFGRCPDAFPQFVSTPDQPWTQPLPPIDGPVADPYPVQAASHWNAAMEMESCEPSRCLDFLSLDDLHQEIRRRDAAASSGSNYGRGMTLVLDDEGKKYIRFLTWAQVWTTFTENNPGTVDAYGELKDDSLDIGLRRVRFLTYSQLTEKYLILLHVGINNQTFTNGARFGIAAGIGPYGAGKKPQIFVHDVWNEYAVVPPSECSDFSLAIGRRFALLERHFAKIQFQHDGLHDGGFPDFLLAEHRVQRPVRPAAGLVRQGKTPQARLPLQRQPAVQRGRSGRR